jgi:hypothetical protein
MPPDPEKEKTLAQNLLKDQRCWVQPVLTHLIPYGFQNQSSQFFFGSSMLRLWQFKQEQNRANIYFELPDFPVETGDEIFLAFLLIWPVY